MSTTVFQLTNDTYHLSYVPAMTAWATAQGLDPATLVVDGLHIDEGPDGALTLHCKQFDIDEAGKRIVVRGPSGTYEDATYASHPFTATVSFGPMLPEVAA